MTTRFKTFLETAGIPAFELFIERVSSDCGQFIAEADPDYPLWRGAKEHADFAEPLRPRENRKARDSTPGFNLMFNAGVKAMSGIDAARSISYFASGNGAQAHGYGRRHFIFPQDEYRFIWSNTIDDSFGSDHDLYTRIADDFEDKTGISGALSPSVVRSFFAHQSAKHQDEKSFLSDPMLMSQALLDQISSSAFSRSAVEQFNTRFAGTDQLGRLFIDALADAFNHLYRSDSLAAATRSGNEIIFIGGGYYMIPVDAVALAYETANPSSEARSPMGLYSWLISEIKKA